MPEDSKTVLELGNEFLFCNVFSFAIKSESIKREALLIILLVGTQQITVG